MMIITKTSVPKKKKKHIADFIKVRFQFSSSDSVQEQFTTRANRTKARLNTNIYEIDWGKVNDTSEACHVVNNI